MALKPAAAWAATTSAGGSSPSLKIVCRCRFARPLDTSANGGQFYVVCRACYNRGRPFTIPARQPPLSLVRRLVVANLDKPVLEVIDSALGCLVEGLDARA